MGLAIVLVSHDLGVLQSVADEVVVMYGGCTIEEGAAEDVLRRPSHPYTRALLAAEPATAPCGEPLAEIPGRPVEPGSWVRGCRFAPRCGHAVDACFDVSPEMRATELGTRAACIRLEELAVRR
jgi:oligopeptide/dipeptide ABC transporter ATP-binding protein